MGLDNLPMFIIIYDKLIKEILNDVFEILITTFINKAAYKYMAKFILNQLY